jgi:hypothetical protein
MSFGDIGPSKRFMTEGAFVLARYDWLAAYWTFGRLLWSWHILFWTLESDEKRKRLKHVGILRERWEISGAMWLFPEGEVHPLSQRRI